MLYPQERDQIRLSYIQAWQKYIKGELLSSLEDQIVRVIIEHPEYQPWLSTQDKIVDKDFSPADDEENPFMHMGLHLAVRDQYQLNQPVGIRPLFDAALQMGEDPHVLEHRAMSVLVQYLFESISLSKAFDSEKYLTDLQIALTGRVG
jgi:hypothetical protein